MLLWSGLVGAGVVVVVVGLGQSLFWVGCVLQCIKQTVTGMFPAILDTQLEIIFLFLWGALPGLSPSPGPLQVRLLSRPGQNTM